MDKGIKDNAQRISGIQSRGNGHTKGGGGDLAAFCGNRKKGKHPEARLDASNQ